MDSDRNFQPDQNLRLMDQVQHVLRYYHYRYRTEQTYCKWILRYIRHHGGKTHPKTMGKTEIESFLSYLAVRERVSASTQRQALNAIMFLYRKALGKDIREKIAPVKAKRRKRPPVVLTQRQVQEMLNHMHGIHKGRIGEQHQDQDPVQVVDEGHEAVQSGQADQFGEHAGDAKAHDQVEEMTFIAPWHSGHNRGSIW
jgi:hypothetical protein